MSIPAIAATQRLTKTAIDVLLKGAEATQDDFELTGGLRTSTPLERAIKSLMDDIPAWFSQEGEYDLACETALMHDFAINTLVAALDRNEIAEWLFVNEQASEIARHQRRTIVENYKSGNSGNLGDLLGEMFAETYYRQADAIIAGILGGAE